MKCNRLNKKLYNINNIQINPGMNNFKINNKILNKIITHILIMDKN